MCAKLYDASRDTGSNLKDFSLLESLFWRAQAGNISTFALLSFGNYGKYVFDVLNSPDGYAYRNGEKTTRKIAHFAQFMTEQEESAIQKTGLRTGRVWDSDGKAQTQRPDTIGAIFEALDEIIALHPDNKNPNTFNVWARQWHVGFASKLGLISGKIETVYRNETKLGDGRKFSFVVNHCLEMNPEELRTAWRKANEKIKAKVKATPKRSNVATAPVVEKTTAIAQAMADKESA